MSSGIGAKSRHRRVCVFGLKAATLKCTAEPPQSCRSPVFWFLGEVWCGEVSVVLLGCLYFFFEVSEVVGLFVCCYLCGPFFCLRISVDLPGPAENVQLSHLFWIGIWSPPCKLFAFFIDIHLSNSHVELHYTIDFCVCPGHFPVSP